MKETLRLKVAADQLESAEARQAIERVAAIWRAGGLVAFPTETVYGLGAHALDQAAVASIFAAKQRPAWDPLIVHVTDAEMLQRVAKAVPPIAQRLANAFWPGPLTLLLPRAAAVPLTVTAGRPLVGVRMPAHPVARALIAAAGVPIAAPSANTFGRTSPSTAAHVLEDLDGRIDAVVDGGPTTHGLESTVVDASGPVPLVYRPGVISLAQLREAVGEVAVFRENTVDASQAPEALPSPGVGLRHYAPRARLVLIEGTDLEDQRRKFQQAVAQLGAPGNRLGLMLPESYQGIETGDALVFAWGGWDDTKELARRLFAGLRELDRRGATHIVCPMPPDEGIGTAMCDRLRKAAKRE